MHVLVAVDEFKGALTTAREVAAAISGGLAAAGVPSTALPLADGGDGSVDAALAAGFRLEHLTVRGADGRPTDTTYAYDGHTAVVEVASTCGLATLPNGRRARYWLRRLSRTRREVSGGRVAVSRLTRHVGDLLSFVICTVRSLRG